MADTVPREKLTPEQAVEMVEKAKCADDIHLTTARLKILIHPDRFGRDEAMAKRAEAAVYKLDALTGIKTPAAASPVTIGKWVVTEPFTKGDIADLHKAESDINNSALLKIAQSARDNDLLEAESKSLKMLNQENPHYARYTPVLLDSFKASGRMVNVMSRANGYYPLSRLTSTIGKIEFRHVVWMMNRALSALGYAHRCGVIHGAVTPEHLLYSPHDHNLCLVDWCYSSTDKPIKAVVKSRRDLYPPEVLRKSIPCAGTDLFMLAGSLQTVADHIPARFKPLFDLCLIQSPSSRPDNAWEFQDRWKDTAEAEYGKPRFLSMLIPASLAD